MRLSPIGKLNLVFAVAAIASILWLSRATCGFAQLNSDWQTGDDFRRQLESQVSITWSQRQLREGLSNLSHNQRVAIWLDRRIDPGHLMELTIDDTSLDATLQKIATSLRVGVSYVDSVAYVGPPDVTAKLATVAALRRDEADSLPPDAQRRFSHRSAWKWEALTTPKELLTELAEESGCRIFGIEHVPHDLWPAGDYPALPVTDRMTLVLAGFGMSFRFAPDGTAIQVTPLPEAASITRTFSTRGDVAQLMTQLQREFPDVEMRRAGPRLTATGSYEDLHMIERLLRGERVQRSTTQPPQTVFTLTIENAPAGAIVKEIAKRSQLALEIDPAVNEQLNALVTVRVKDASLEDLLKATLGPAQIRFQLEGQSLKLLPADR